jgi:hypothetical protein
MADTGLTVTATATLVALVRPSPMFQSQNERAPPTRPR